MPYIETDDAVRIYYEEAGTGFPILFIHEFGGDHRSWEGEVRHFSRRYRCIVYAARGFTPSDVPEEIDRYSQRRAMLDAIAVLDELKIDKAHIVGLSMGGFCALHLGLNCPDRARSLVVAGTGYGAEKKMEKYFQGVSEQVAENFTRLGSEKFAPIYAEGASRVQFQNKDPRGWTEFAKQLGEHSSLGAANTMRGVQARRPSLYDLEDKFRKMTVPTLIISGDEDDHCLQPGIFLKVTLPASGLLILPKTGHTINLEEPASFHHHLDKFFAMVEAGKWLPRDPRANPDQVMRTLSDVEVRK